MQVMPGSYSLTCTGCTDDTPSNGQHVTVSVSKRARTGQLNDHLSIISAGFRRTTF